MQSEKRLTGDEDVEEVEGIGRVTGSKLRRLGITTVRELAEASPDEIEEAVGSRERALELILRARELLGLDIFEEAKTAIQKIRGKTFTTGCKKIDEFLGGGIYTKATYELAGAFGSGKSTFCHQLSVTVQLPEDSGGLERGAVYIDTEGTFSPTKIAKISKRFNIDPDKALENIKLARAYTVDEVETIIRLAKRKLRDRKVGLLVIDSIMAPFRAEYTGLEMLAERQRRLARLAIELNRLAEKLDIAVVVTNQVITQIGKGPPGTTVEEPLGGFALGHNIKYRLKLTKKKGGIRTIKFIDSPEHPTDTEVQFKIADDGIRD